MPLDRASPAVQQIVKARYAERLIAARSSGIGYLSKDRVSDLHEFVAAVRTVAAGGAVFDPALGTISLPTAGT